MRSPPTIRDMLETTFPRLRWQDEIRSRRGPWQDKASIGLPYNAEMAVVGNHLIAFYTGPTGLHLNWYMPSYMPVLVESFTCDCHEDIVGSLSSMRSQMQTLAIQSLARICHPGDLFPLGAKKGFYAMREPLDTLLHLDTSAGNIPALVGKWLFKDCFGHWRHENNRMALKVNGAQKGYLVARYERPPSITGEPIPPGKMIARYRIKVYPIGVIELECKGTINVPPNRADSNDLVEECLLRTYAQEVFTFLQAQKNDWGYLPI